MILRRLIALSARYRWLVLVAVAAACLVAWKTLAVVRLDALPDLSDTQVIVQTAWDRPPDQIEDQITYPLVTTLLGAPKVKAVRGFSDFGQSLVYVLFEDGTDLYWARSRVLELMSGIGGTLPDGVRPVLGPDATAVGWVYQYALVDRSGRLAPDELRSLQDWTLRFALRAVPGVSEVASFGGAVRQLQVVVDPNRLASYGVPIEEVVEAVRQGNRESGGRLLEWSGAEYMVRLRGYARTPEEVGAIVVRALPGGLPLRVADVARVEIGPEQRRGAGDLDGEGDAVGGIVVARHGENALNVVRRVQAKLHDLGATLPSGVEIVMTYDRSDLILRAIATLRHELVLEMVVVSLVILLFLWHFPSAIVPIVTIPVSVLLAFIPLHLLGISVNLMSLAGIAISIGVLVDGAIVEVENAYHRIHLWQRAGGPASGRTFHEVRLAALQEVGPSVFFSLFVIAVAFLPIFALVDQEGRLFGPLAWSKTLAMALAALLAVTLDPALRMLFSRAEPFRFRPAWLARAATSVAVGRYRAEEEHPVSRAIHAVYEPVCRAILRRPRTTIAIAVVVLLASLPAYFALGSEFMPPLSEGTILFMPTTLPGISIGEASRLLEAQDRVLASFPEVLRVHGKAGRADTATDPAPLSMFETVVTLRPESEWRAKARFYDRWPEWTKPVFRPFAPDRISREELVAEMDAKLRAPGVTNAWTQPIQARLDMLSTGVRTPVGIKVLGSDLAELERAGEAIERAVAPLRGTRSAFAERAGGGYFLDVVPRAGELARHGLRVEALQRTVAAAVGGENVTTTIEGRARYPVNVRYPRELRDDPDRLARVLVPVPSGAQVPLGQLATIEVAHGPAMVRDENGFLASYVFVDVAGRDLGSWVEEAKARVAAEVPLPQGTTLLWSGQWENMLRVRERLRLLVPAAIALIALLLFLNLRSGFKVFLVLAILPFSAIGAVWLFHLLGYDVSIAAWVGLIALLGLDAETAVFMLLFLDLSWNEAAERGELATAGGIDEAIVHGAVKRARPKMMTVAAAFLGLLPILFSTSAGADVMKRIATPMIGGLVTSFLAELLLYPAAYKLWKGRSFRP